MQQYHRLMRRQEPNVYTDDEQAELFRLMLSAPGVSEVEVAGRHPKGGYVTRFELSPDAADEFFAYLLNHDWGSVI
jgi:hypothetical protein